MLRKSFIFCGIFFCILTGIACYGEEGYNFFNFPPAKGKFKEVTAVQTYDWMTVTTVGIIDANGYITEVKTKEDDILMTTGKYTFTATGKMKEKLSLYKDKIYSKEVYSYDKKDRLIEIRYHDALNSPGEMKLSGITAYTYEGDTRKAAFRTIDAAGNTLVLKGTARFDEACRIIEEVEERYNGETKEWEICKNVNVYDKKGYWIEFHHKCGDNSIDSFWEIFFDKASGLPVRFVWYPNKEKTESTGDGVVFTYK